MQSHIDPAPSEDLIEKFIYFYKPYSFQGNTKKFMTFSDEIQEGNRDDL